MLSIDSPAPSQACLIELSAGGEHLKLGFEHDDIQLARKVEYRIARHFAAHEHDDFISIISAVRTTWGLTSPVSKTACSLTNASTSLIMSLPQAVCTSLSR